MMENLNSLKHDFDSYDFYSFSKDGNLLFDIFLHI